MVGFYPSKFMLRFHVLDKVVRTVLHNDCTIKYAGVTNNRCMKKTKWTCGYVKCIDTRVWGALNKTLYEVVFYLCRSQPAH